MSGTDEVAFLSLPLDADLEEPTAARPSISGFPFGRSYGPRGRQSGRMCEPPHFPRAPHLSGQVKPKSGHGRPVITE
ncbi:hypothetical protein SLUN_21660 [Streptomyces lunaelactis]|uniref:Uncharacterized protein n=1 Tax=Streptomyces lunaelactis TaxID=1535768 RepID=A0A2R4T5I2_9ACTN|nr:hypothetical protein [Streptomyces lunaelactis]AVZ74382.1 hypothetical protein SLUN_21660 [Streptomyces lunaelactis]NUK89909.1 hypothetical protein [Streptomyces lunaelactis]